MSQESMNNKMPFIKNLADFKEHMRKLNEELKSRSNNPNKKNTSVPPIMNQTQFKQYIQKLKEQTKAAKAKHNTDPNQTKSGKTLKSLWSN